MTPKQNIHLSIDWEDYQALKKDSRGISGAIREAILQYLCKPQPTLEKIVKQRDALQQQILILTGEQQTDELTPFTSFPSELNDENRTTNNN